MTNVLTLPVLIFAFSHILLLFHFILVISILIPSFLCLMHSYPSALHSFPPLPRSSAPLCSCLLLSAPVCSCLLLCGVWIQSAVLFLESLVGQENVYTLAMFLETVIRFLAEGAASGLNVIAVYVTEILRVTGFDATLPPVTPEAVTAVAQWGLLTLIGYWVLAIVLRLLIGIVRQVFWIIKTVLALWFFGLIVLDKTASADTTAVRLTGLVLVCVLLTLLTSGSEKTSAVEQRISSLEGRLKVVEKSKGD
ncbi:uncharacterized protein LOC110160722 isoform X1 [Boleophthalmus pectinirostris]|uniref:uncharacterized protein LOC110160722 isoform X1 n=1 Tax=Boleophthalmus pectinirostris TaxID=150288 RepID=UPI002432FFBF|nr:uncharacterized protein LOC110160722 isoform X1 [Boleophthalmus pectinirostris]